MLQVPNRHNTVRSVLLASLSMLGCSGEGFEDWEEVESATEAVRVSSQLDCSGSTCTVPNMPLLGQTSSLVDVEIDDDYKEQGCYDTSMATVLASSIDNRSSTQALKGRVKTYANIVSGNNGGTPPATTTRAYEQLSQEYRWAVKYHTDIAAGVVPPSQPFHFLDALSDFAGTARRSSAACDPRVYASCNWLTLEASDFAGAAFRDFTDQVSHVTNDYIKSLMNVGFGVMIAYGRYVPAPCKGAPSVKCFSRVSQHKVAFSGYQSGAYPLRINDVGNATRYNVTLSDDLSPFGISNANARFPNGKAAQTYLRYDPSVAPTSEIYFVDHVDALSLGLESGNGVDQVFSGTWSAGFTSFMPFVLNGQPHQLAYNATTGTVHFDRFFANANGAETLWDYTWGAGWSHFVPYYIGGYPYFVAYNQSSGELHFDTFPQNLQGAIVKGTKTIASGFTSIVSFVLAGENYLLLYNKSTGAVRFDRLNSIGSNASTAWNGSWGTGWTDFVPYYIGGKPYLIAYNSSSGEMHYDRISESLFGTIGIKSFTAPTGMKLAPVAFDGPGYYGSTTNGGTLKFERMTNDGGDSSAVWQASGLSSATTVISFKQAGKTYQLLYNKANGAVRAYRVNLF